MSNSAEKLQSLLNQSIMVNGLGVSCYLEPKQFNEINWIAIFYNSDSVTNIRALHLGRQTQIGFYVTPIKITSRHNDYETSRNMAFDTLEFLSVQRNSLSASFIQTIPNQAPTYEGIDESGGYLWTIEINLIGGR